MQPKKFRSEMNNAFNIWFEMKSAKGFTPSLQREIHRVWKKRSKNEDDYRNGEDTYKYCTKKSIRQNMLYVSDRWNCAFRLKWLLDGLKGGHIS